MAGDVSTDWVAGDVFAGVGSGLYDVFANDGTFKNTINDGLGGFTTGCSFDPPLEVLYTTNFSRAYVVLHDEAAPHDVIDQINTSGEGGGQPESVVFDSDGNYYVGHAGGNRDIFKYAPDGTLLATYDVATERRGSDWIDLAADQQTMYYTSEGRRIMRYDVGADAQLADFATLPGSSVAYALRLLPPGDGTGGLLVADTENIKRLDGDGNVVQTYTAAGESTWFSLNLDPDGETFWAGNFGSGVFYQFDIASGALLQTVDTERGGSALFGICLHSELTAAEDSDGDGVPDFEDNCPETANPDQADSDGDGIGDVCDEPDDTDAPVCELVNSGLDSDGRRFIEVSALDAVSGLADISVILAENIIVDIPPFEVGTTDAVIFRATKVDQDLAARVGLEATDVAGNSGICDPIDVTVARERGQPVTHTWDDVPEAERWVDVTNGSYGTTGTPGLTSLRLTVNGREFQVAGMKDGEYRRLDIGSALEPGNANVVSLTPLGRPGGSAWVLIHDAAGDSDG